MPYKPKSNVNNKYDQYATNYRLLIFKPWKEYSHSFRDSEEKDVRLSMYFT